ncbi:MAG: Sec-independent protein translocase subunit TatA/TatB [Solirubrobacterales bacterium]
MPNVGPLELVIVLIIALIVFGPKRLPEMGRSLGRGIREFKGSLSSSADDDEEDAPRISSSREDDPAIPERQAPVAGPTPVACATSATGATPASPVGEGQALDGEVVDQRPTAS